MALLSAIAVVMLYFFPVFGLGTFFIRVILGRSLPPELAPPLGYAASALLLGQGLLAVAWLALGLAGWFHPAVILATLLACLLLGGRPAWGLGRKALGQLRQSLWEIWRDAWPWRVLFLFCLMLMLLLGMSSFAGPVVVGSDSSAFYMVLPKIMAHAHRLIPTGEFVAKHSTFGFLGEMHFAALMALGAGTVAKGSSFITALAAAVMLLAMGSLAGLGRRGQLIVVAVLLSSTGFTNYIVDGKIDIFAAALGLAAAHWALKLGTPRDRRVFVLTGLFLGWAVYAKLSLLVALAFPLLVLILWRGWLACPETDRAGLFFHWSLPGVIILGSCLLAVLIPLMLKNQLLFGEPLAPVYYFQKSWGSWFSVRHYTSADIQRLILTYPLAVVLGHYYAQAGNISPLALTFVPLTLLMPRPARPWRSTLVQITMAAVLGMVTWVILFPKGIGIRFVLPTLLLFALPAARGAEFVLSAKPRLFALRALVWITLFFVPVWLLYEGHKYYRGPVHFLAKARDFSYAGRQFLESGQLVRHPAIAALEEVNRRARPGDRVLAGIIYRYWLRADLLTCLVGTKEWNHLFSLPPPALAFGPSPQAAAAWSYLFNRGVKFVVLDSQTHGSLQKRLGIDGQGGTGAPPWLQVTRIYHHSRWSVYQLRSRDHKRKPQVDCRQILGR